MEPPKLEKMVTPYGFRWYVTYAGMVREYKHDWAAEWHYRQACEFYLATRRSDF